jgi:murein L,D-transpeptidase YcbB/YkuD
MVACACTNNQEKDRQDIVAEPEQMNERVVKNIQQFLDYAVSNEGKLNDSITFSLADVVNNFYKTNNYQSVWSSKENWLPIADSLMLFIERSKEYGLFPEDYHYTNLLVINNRFAADTLSVADKRDASLWAKADLMLTDAFFRISSHLYAGRLRSDSIYKKQDSVLTDVFYQKNLDAVLKGGGVVKVFHSLEPLHQGYIDLRYALKNFIDSANFKVPYTYVSYPYKDSIAFIKTLVRRLKEESAIPWQTKEVDTAQLKTAIIQVQKKRGLKVDGKFGIQLVRSLNSTDEEKFKRIAINLDRYKMIPYPLPQRYIWVNLPSFYLQLWENDTVKIESRVVVGKPNTRTPLLTSQISNIVTYPQWTIPNSIILKEILPALKRNPGYLEKKGYMLTSWEGEEIDPYTVDWEKYTKGIPYRIVQGSGDANALGILKFNFPNKYSVYLHDTNQRYLFKNENRALSHGCVRVQEWEKLTYYISALDSMNYEADENYMVGDSIKVWLKRKEKHVIPVKSKIPVYFRYFTATGKNGKVVFYDDIYGEDKAAREVYFLTK